MPARFVTSRGNEVDVVSGFTTAAGITLTLNVNPLGRERMLGLVSAMWVGGVDSSSAPFGASFGGEAMPLKGSRLWDSNEEGIYLWLLEDIEGGPNEIDVAVSGMPTGDVNRTLQVVAAAYHGYETVGDLVQAGGTTSSSNTVTLTGGVEAGRFISVHGTGKTGVITGQNRSKRAESRAWFYGNMILQDAPGGASVAMTANQNSNSHWGALGFPITASQVDIGADLSVGPAELSTAGIGVYDRDVEPSPDRYWRLPANPGEEIL